MCVLMVVSDGERKAVNRSPSPKGGMGSVDHTFIKDESAAAVALIEQTDAYIDDMKKGTSNILV